MLPKRERARLEDGRVRASDLLAVTFDVCDEQVHLLDDPPAVADLDLVADRVGLFQQEIRPRGGGFQQVREREPAEKHHRKEVRREQHHERERSDTQLRERDQDSNIEHGELREPGKHPDLGEFDPGESLADQHLYLVADDNPHDEDDQREKHLREELDGATPDPRCDGDVRGSKDSEEGDAEHEKPD